MKLAALLLCALAATVHAAPESVAPATVNAVSERPLSSPGRLLAPGDVTVGETTTDPRRVIYTAPPSARDWTELASGNPPFIVCGNAEWAAKVADGAIKAKADAGLLVASRSVVSALSEEARILKAQLVEVEARLLTAQKERDAALQSAAAWEARAHAPKGRKLAFVGGFGAGMIVDRLLP